MYYFEQSLVDKAIHHYCITWCGEFDEEFYIEMWYMCYGDPTLEACIVMDYIDAICKDLYNSVCSDFSTQTWYGH